MRRNFSTFQFLIIFLVALLAACTAAPAALGAGIPPDPDWILIQNNYTETPTPFQPLPITATPSPTITPTPNVTATPTIPRLATSTPISDQWVGYPGPSVYPAIAIPPPIGLITQPKDQINILLLGSDQRPYDGAFRTDVIILATINAQDKTVTLTSFPRDLFVYIPGWTMERINTAMFYGGFQSMQTTFEYNFGVRPDHYALINFEGFKDLIDEMGGIYVQVGEKLVDQRDGYGKYAMKAGLRKMDGETALWYVRSRKTTNDFDRTRRQQEVLQAIFFRLLSIDALSKAPKLYDKFEDTIQTDMKFGNILSLSPLALQIASDGEFRGFAIGSSEVYGWVNPYNGAQVLLPDQFLVKRIMKDALNNK
jgi:LCP family protein required for cell wall assembly